MNNKNVLFWVGVKDPGQYMQEKHGGFKYLDISEECWKIWCEKNDVTFFPYRHEHVGDNLNSHRVTWQRWFDVFRVLDEAGIEYDKICVIDGSTLIHWDAPNFIDMAPSTGLTVFRSLENLRWISEGVFGYKSFFGDFEFDLTQYFSCGFQIFTKEHRPFLEKLKEFYYNSYTAIMKLQNEKIKRGTDQPVYNYFAQIEGIDVNLNALPQKFFITHLNRFDWLGHNWQLLKRTHDPKYGMPHFIRHSYIWFYSGFPQRGQRYDLMQQTWDLIKEKYV